ncbi:helix-turn-helix domain-containing protein [Nitratireductor thuwali]|uniref:HTH cro/C1-type domain-containing protein n=1 Tax=Nitratireductor thuwali TaxID=2267699 RepID=A0ABY5MRR6_9HYPH|nr:hypothetical protein NTH_03985 [Nitratireductor thuwali]
MRQADVSHRAVGLRLKQRRMMQDITQKELARAAGISYQQIQKYERGENGISASRLSLFAEVLGVAPSYFLGGAEIVGLTHSESRQPDLLLMRELIELNKLFPLIPDEAMRRALIQVIELAARAET